MGPDGDSDTVIADVRASGVTSAVVVQAVGAYGFDSSCAASVVAANAGWARLLPALDLSQPQPSLEGLAAEAPIVGVRLFGVADGAPWLDDERADIVWSSAASLGVPIVATVFTDRLPALQAVMARHRDVVVVLDHCAFPDMAGPSGEAALMELAAVEEVRLKVTTHVLAAWDAEARLEQMVTRLAAGFGAHRLCWGSDHPQHQGLTHQHKLDLARRATRNLSTAEQHDFFAGTATALGWA
jgi:predicted TIM-barrel fold metal-dependent hydrolase